MKVGRKNKSVKAEFPTGRNEGMHEKEIMRATGKN